MAKERIVGLAVLALVVATVGSARAENKCQGAKAKAAGKKAACIVGGQAKVLAKGGTFDSSKCIAKFNSAFSKAEAKGGCSTTGDATAIENKVDAFATDLTTELSPGAPNKCQGAKAKLAGKKAACILSAEAKVLAKGATFDASKCISKFTSAFSKDEAKGGCGTTGDVTAIENKVDSFTTDVTTELSPASTTTTTVSTTSTTTTTTTFVPGVVVGSLPTTAGSFSYNMTPGLAGAEDACNTNFAGSHACRLSELQATPASALMGLKDTTAMTVTSFWAIDPAADPVTAQCCDDVNFNPCTSANNWEYGTAHTMSRGQKVPLNNSTGVIGALVTGVQCNFAPNNWVGCCK